MKISLNQLLGSFLFLSLASPVAAHNIKTDRGVGATFHIEPNHNPRAGEQSRAWFALTHEGGKSIPLEECNCQLSVRLQSSDRNNRSIANPPLKAVTAEEYKNIPGADIVFSQAGIYDLEIRGTPKGNADFEPFKLSYSVTVLPGKEKPQEKENRAAQPTQESKAPVVDRSGWQGVTIAIASVALLGAIAFWLLKQPSKNK
jgi:hypothetical protein